MVIIPAFKDLTGQQFGKWTVIEQAEPSKDNRGHNVIRWRCRCDCGTVKDVFGNSLRSGSSKSCGCDIGERANVARNNFTTHGETKTKLYQIWAGMRKRCLNKNAYNYNNYGGRGIKICDEWSDYTAFKEWALSNGYGNTLSIDRIDVNGYYEPSNCRWVDRVAQANNRRNTPYYTHNGETHSLADWARILNIGYKSLHKKLRSGMEFAEAIKK